MNKTDRIGVIAGGWEWSLVVNSGAYRFTRKALLTTQISYLVGRRLTDTYER